MIAYSSTHSYFHLRLLLIVYLLLWRDFHSAEKLIRRCHVCSHRTTSYLNNLLCCIAMFISLLLFLLWLLWLRYIASIIVVCSIDFASSYLIQNQIHRFICLHNEFQSRWLVLCIYIVIFEVIGFFNVSYMIQLLWWRTWRWFHWRHSWWDEGWLFESIEGSVDGSNVGL